MVTGFWCPVSTALPAASSEFLNTKRLYNKNDGRMFYSIQSFHLGRKSHAPKPPMRLVLQLAEQFAGFEVVVATHTDRDHIHSHLIINSVSVETGKKYHSDKDNIQHLRDVSDGLCRAYGLSVLKPKPKKTSTMSSREYRAADKGQAGNCGWRLPLTMLWNLHTAMSILFLSWKRKAIRFGVDGRPKYITYTTPGGDRCRDNKLHEEKYRKENMEYEFRIRAEIAAGIEEPGTAGSRTNRSLRSGHGQQLAGLINSLKVQLQMLEDMKKQMNCLATEQTMINLLASQIKLLQEHAKDTVEMMETYQSWMEDAAANQTERWRKHPPRCSHRLGRSASSFPRILPEVTQQQKRYTRKLVLDFSDPGIDYTGLGMDAAYLAAGMTNILEEDPPIEDSTTKHYRPEREHVA